MNKYYSQWINACISNVCTKVAYALFVILLTSTNHSLLYSQTLTTSTEDIMLTEKYILVTGADTLVAGDVLIIADSISKVVAANQIGINYTGEIIDYQKLLTTDATFSADKKLLTSLGENFLRVTLGGEEHNWTLTSQDGKQLCTNNGGSGYVWDNTTAKTNTWLIIITDNFLTTIRSNINVEKKILYSPTSKYFVYNRNNITNHEIQLYRKNAICALNVVPTITEYPIGGTIDPATVTVTATYYDGTSRVVTGATFSSCDFSTAGTNTVTVSYTEDGKTLTTTYDVVVIESSILDIIDWGTYADANKRGVTINMNEVDPEMQISIWEERRVSDMSESEENMMYIPLVQDGVLINMQNTDGTFTIPLDVDNLACKRIKIETKKGEEVILSTKVRVPIIIDANETTNGETFKAIGDIHKANEEAAELTTEEIAEICKTCDVVVKNNAELTHNNGEYPQINNLYIYPNAKLKVQDGIYTINSVILRSEGDNVPHLLLPNTEAAGLESILKQIRFTKRISNDRFYFFSVPFTCQVADIRLSNGLGEYGVDFMIVEYDGERRAKEGSDGNNWKIIPVDSKLVPGKGYNIAVSSELKIEVVFPMTIVSTALHSLDNTSHSFDVTAHGVGVENGLKPNHLGWNLVAHPYFTTYAELADEDIKVGRVELNADNQYEWVDPTNVYVTHPEIDGNNTVITYKQTLASQQKLPPFQAFFVQAGTTGTLDFVPTNVERALFAPRKVPVDDNRLIYAGVTLSNGQKTDETSLVINDHFTQAYEIGADLEKMIGFADKPQLYVQDDAYCYAFKALNEKDAAAMNNIGVYLPAKETTIYTFDVIRNYDLTQIQGIYLTDKVAGVTTNLMQSAYTFTSAYAYTNTRFSLSVVLKPEVVTSLMDTEIVWSVWQDAPLHISLQGLMRGDDVRVVDATGKLVNQRTMTDTTAQFTLSSVGVYCVQVIGANGLQVKKIVIR